MYNQDIYKMRYYIILLSFSIKFDKCSDFVIKWQINLNGNLPFILTSVIKPSAMEYVQGLMRYHFIELDL